MSDAGRRLIERREPNGRGHRRWLHARCATNPTPRRWTRGPCLDSDGDGITDVFEGAPDTDTDGDGTPDYFLMDTTGSMGGSITSLQSAIRTALIPGIRTEVADTWFGVGEFRDYGISPYGSPGDQPFTNFQDITGVIADAQSATMRYTPRGENDGPESHGQAMYALATGSGLPSSTVGARSGCPAGTFGYACFRNVNPYTGIAGEPRPLGAERRRGR